MTGLDDDLKLLAAEYALGTLDGADRARAQALENSADDFRAELARWRDYFAALDDTATALPPDPDLWERIAARIDAVRAEGSPVAAPARPARATAPGLLQSLTLWRPLAFASLIAAFVMAGVLYNELARGPESPVYIAVLNTDQGKAAAVVNVYKDGTAEFVPLEDMRAPSGRVIVIWTQQNAAQGMISVGKLAQAHRVKLDLRKLFNPGGENQFALSLEPAGAPIDKPTGPVIMKGVAAKGI